MIIYLNNQSLSLESSCTLQDVLTQKKEITTHMAIAINNQFIPNNVYHQTFLKEGDRIDLIVPMQGG